MKTEKGRKGNCNWAREGAGGRVLVAVRPPTPVPFSFTPSASSCAGRARAAAGCRERETRVPDSLRMWVGGASHTTISTLPATPVTVWSPESVVWGEHPIAGGEADAHHACGDEMKNATREKRIAYGERSASPGAPNQRHAQIPFPMNAASFSRTPLGRALLHAACLCRHPACARFFFTGLRRNLREWQHHEWRHHRAHRRLNP